jgi:hypothetical protein
MGTTACWKRLFLPVRVFRRTSTWIKRRFTSWEGTLEAVRLGPAGLEWFPVSAGDSIHVPSNEIHGLRNAGTTNARTLVTATAGLAEFIAEAGIPIPPGTSPPAGPPSAADVERVLTIARKYGHRFVQKQA